MAGDAGRLDVVIEQLCQIVVAWDLMFLATFFVQVDLAAGLRTGIGVTPLPIVRAAFICNLVNLRRFLVA